ncbi:MAG TPA: DUF6062 family protein [Actinomycetota bacterium]|nr:DUF6062 family protein [Actinomycetota bacterium]
MRRAALTPVGYHDLLRDLERPGCPACRGAARAADRFLEAVLWEMVTDPGVRERFRAAHGLCRDHAFLLLQVASRTAQATGVAILYQDFLAHVAEEVERAAAEGSGRRGRRAARGGTGERLRPHAPCPACEPARRVAEAYLRLLAHAPEASEIGRAARREGRGLCLPHLALGLELAEEGTEVRRLAEIFLRGEAELRAELAGFVRKHDHRFRGEPMSEGERSSWVRAVHRLVGAPWRSDGPA